MPRKKQGSSFKKDTTQIPRRLYKNEAVFSGRQVCKILLGMFALFMIVLWFVPEAQPEHLKEEQQPDKPKKRKKPAKPPRKPKFEITEQNTLEELNNIIKSTADEDRLLVLVMDNGNPEDPNKGKLWSRWERLAKAMRTKTLFQRYAEDELPLVSRVDCSDQNTLCQNLLGGQPARPLLLKPLKQPKVFSSDLRTDRHFLEFLFDEMQPAVRYIEEKNDIVDFMEAHNVVVFLFGDDVNATLETAADNMRELARFGRNRDPEVAAHFDISTEDLPVMIMYRDHDENAVYDGDMGSGEMITNWVRALCLPPFGEYNMHTQKRYMGMNVPIFWVYLDRLDESFAEIERAVLLEVLPVMKEQNMRGLVTYIDALSNAEVAKNMGAEEYPMILILSGQKHYHVPLDMDNPGRTMVETITEWHQENSAGSMQGGGDEYYYEDYEDEEDEDEKIGGGTTGAAPDDLYEDDDDDVLYDEYADEKQELRRRLMGISVPRM